MAVFALSHAMLFTFGLMTYWLKENLSTARSTFGVTYAIARAAGLVLHLDVALILFPVCRTLISYARRTPLAGIIPFDEHIEFHKMVGWSMVFFTTIHIVAHWNNFAQLAAKNKLGFKGFLQANFTTGPGWSGYMMLLILGIMVWTSIEKRRKANFERFWTTHHLFIAFFIFCSIHGAFCMIKPDAPPFCNQAGNFWIFWIYGAVVYLVERVLREVRGRQVTFISKVVQHPSRVVEIQIKKEGIKTRAGQFILICCPEVSMWQYHPFTLTSAPEEDYISVHIRCVGDFTTSLAAVLGCDFDNGTTDPTSSAVVGVNRVTSNSPDIDPTLRKVLPRLYIDGPFGSASEDVFKYEVVALVGAGIGATPFASVLKSIWYRMNYPQQKTRLRKVYFFWVCRDFGSFEWFRSLLSAIEAQDLANSIEIHTYLTAPIRLDDQTNIMINNSSSERDAITGLRAPTHFGRPNWDNIFKSIKQEHAPGQGGVFFCGPKPLGDELSERCNNLSDSEFRFVWGKESF
ncbi:MAG: hypothetical protein M1823_005078 [Watsoniomyces obsoletus]|nr:MAG: hypothetical protein M1823_005078 [Watsoniomyces obsoletus]